MKKTTFDLSTYLKGDNSVDMVPPTSDQVLSFHIKYF